MSSLEAFLKKNFTNEKSCITHTKIGSSELNISGGSFHIPESKSEQFYKIYKNHVFDKKKQAFLTEKQLEIGQIALDFDFRYKPHIEKRQHKFQHITSLVNACVQCFDDIYQSIDGKTISFYIFEKPNVNLLEDKTKDGLHVIINIDCDVSTKLLFRKYLLKEVDMIWDDLPLTNNWDNVIDEGVLKGSCNWTLYGSRKPGNEAYELKYMFKAVKSETTDDVNIEQVNISTLQLDDYFTKISVRNKEGLIDTFQIKPDKIPEYNEIRDNNTKKRKLNPILKKAIIPSNINYDSINDEETLNMIIEAFKEDENVSHHLKEVHEYTMALPEEYWGPGSYDKWIRVGWALKNTDEKLYITWLKFSSQSDEFDWLTHDMREKWESFDFYNDDSGVSDKSIIFWCKSSNPEKFNNIYRSSIHHYIYMSLMSNTDYDIASALYHLYNGNFICASQAHDSWYEFKHNKWEKNELGCSLRNSISEGLFNEYKKVFVSIQIKYNEQQNKTNNDGDGGDSQNKMKIQDLHKTVLTLRQTTRKNSIMREAKEIFYDNEFFDRLDKDNYLLGCKNCIIDFREKRHRKGKPDDYVSKSTNIQYLPLSHYQSTCPNVIDDINEFMSQLYPDEELRKYMWEHLASTLLGTTHNQTFNIYTGSGANGKSKLIELMSMVLGDYKATVPITLITQKRSQIGSASPEIANLVGIRYAVMQEPSKGDTINEGIVKEITGGDPIQARALFQDSITFIPQCKLVVATNIDININSDDDGTWRRICSVPHDAKFTANPYNDPKYPKEQYPYQFKIDTELGNKFEIWAPVMLSMLVDLAYITQGKVEIVDAVKSKSDEYRKGQNVLFEFYNDNIDPNPPAGKRYNLKISVILEVLKDWHSKVHGNRSAQPNRKEVVKFFEQKHGKSKSGGWAGIRLKEIQDEMIDSDDE